MIKRSLVPPYNPCKSIRSKNRKIRIQSQNIRLISRSHLNSIYQKSNFPMTPHVRLLFDMLIGWSVGWFFGNNIPNILICGGITTLYLFFGNDITNIRIYRGITILYLVDCQMGIYIFLKFSCVPTPPNLPYEPLRNPAYP